MIFVKQSSRHLTVGSVTGKDDILPLYIYIVHILLNIYYIYIYIIYIYVLYIYVYIYIFTWNISEQKNRHLAGMKILRGCLGLN